MIFYAKRIPVSKYTRKKIISLTKSLAKKMKMMYDDSIRKPYFIISYLEEKLQRERIAAEGTSEAVPTFHEIFRQRNAGWTELWTTGRNSASFSLYFLKLIPKEKNKMIFLITNNPMVNLKLHGVQKISCVFIEGNHLDVLVEVRNRVHNNHKLLTHPLSGSVKPNETPYKSILMVEGSQLDFDSLEWIEGAIHTYHKLQKDKPTPQWIDSVKADFMVIDFDLIKNALPDYLYF